MRMALAQLNPTIGDVRGNTRLVLDAIERAADGSADLLVCPEMVLLGYPPRDLVWREGVVETCEEAVREVARATRRMTVVLGHPRHAAEGIRPIRNSASICRDGQIVCQYDKRLLPGYDVFDDDRYFEPGRTNCHFDAAGRRFGVLICEDFWRARDVEAGEAIPPHFLVDPAAELVRSGCDALIVLSASPFVAGKGERHRRQLAEAAVRFGVPIVNVNQTGANDDLIFDGRSAAFGADGSVLLQLPAFESAVDTVDPDSARPVAVATTDESEELFRALVLGVGDYCRKIGREEVIVGLSGGIDSALTATIAAAALGADRVTGVLMPSKHSSAGATTDARALAANLKLGGIREVSIRELHDMARSVVGAPLAGTYEGVPDENVQARLRGLIVMAISNATGALVLATGNKSELATGYSTLYGDMCGAIAVLADVLKTRVYSIARWVNANFAACGFAVPPVPESSILKAPSAELRPNQTDQDTLPPYDLLDEIIHRYVELEQSADRVACELADDPRATADLVRRITTLIDQNEFKRNQAAVILKVSPRTFGRGRPMPIVMRQTRIETGEDVEPRPARDGSGATVRR